MSDQAFVIENAITDKVIGCAIEVHRAIGPGLLESVYHECMRIELQHAGMTFVSEVDVPIVYRDRELQARHRVDLLVEERVIVELKAVDILKPIHDAQVLTYLRLTSRRVGLLLNFNVSQLRQGLRRLVL